MGSSKQLDPSVWETIFASPIAILAARIVVLSAAVVLLVGGLYIVVSILYRMRHSQWLRRAGPFEAHLAEEAKEGLEGGDALQRLYDNALEENEVLTAKAAEGHRQFKELADAYRALAEHRNTRSEKL